LHLTDSPQALLCKGRLVLSVPQARNAYDDGLVRYRLALANLQQAQLNAEYTDIRAPITGRVTKKAVEIGQVVSPGQPLLSVVDLDDLWVIANFKETELTRVRPGQSATVEVDTYPSKRFKARVDSIQGGSGAVFSLLPPENATGNYVKIVQRIPVKIVLAPGENAGHLLVPGMSVVPTITLRGGPLEVLLIFTSLLSASKGAASRAATPPTAVRNFLLSICQSPLSRRDVLTSQSHTPAGSI